MLSEEVPQLRWVVWGRRSTRKRGVWVAWARLLGRREALQIRRKRNMISGEAMVTYHAEVEEFLEQERTKILVYWEEQSSH